jgi:hypothetical protein
MTEKRSRRCDIGRTDGSPGPSTRPGIDGGFCVGGAGEGACARMDAWLLENRKNDVKTPATNDANAIVILDITPPEGTGGKLWFYHYRNPNDNPGIPKAFTSRTSGGRYGRFLE